MENILEYHHCPPGYCQCSKVDDNSEACTSVYSYDDENDQCVCDREGMSDMYMDQDILYNVLYCQVNRCRHTTDMCTLYSSKKRNFYFHASVANHS